MSKLIAKIIGIFLLSMIVLSLSPGVGVANHTNEGLTADAHANSGDTFWKGQKLYFNNGEISGNVIPELQGRTVYQIRTVTNDGDVGSLITEFGLNENGSAVLNTANLNGKYVIAINTTHAVEVNDGIAVGVTEDASSGSWEVTPQSLSVSFDDNKIFNSPRPTSKHETGFTITSNRGVYDLILSSDRLNLTKIFGSEAVSAINSNHSRVMVGGSTSKTLRANFNGIEPGRYIVIANVADSEASSTASIMVEKPPEPSASFGGADPPDFLDNVSRLRERVEKLQAKVDELQERIDELNSSNQNLQERIDTLESELDEKESTISELRNENNELRTLVNRTQRKNQALMGEIRNLTTNNSELREQVERLRNERQALQQELNESQETNENLSNRVDELTRENQNLTNRVQELEGRVLPGFGPTVAFVSLIIIVILVTRKKKQ